MRRTFVTLAMACALVCGAVRAGAQPAPPDSTGAAPDSLPAPAPNEDATHADSLAAPGDSVAAPTAAPATAAHEPATTKFSYRYDTFQQSVVRPATRAFDPALLVRKLAHRPREAANVDERDRVRLPSTWWQPRVGYKNVTVEDLRAGPGSGDGPASGPWTVVQAKTEGVSKGFQIVDANGVRYAIKFDPPGDPELSTGAEAVASRLLWAAGYNVPDNTIAWFRREDLVVKPGAKTTIAGRETAMTQAALDALLRGVAREPDGRYRVVASRFLAGKPLGEFLYSGVRRDDPEDLIPHELRRELRGMWAIAAWVNHTDCSARNTLDSWVSEGGRSFVRHHLLDFSGCLGSASIQPQPLQAGHEYFVDYGTLAHAFVTLGFSRSQWERTVIPHLRGVGNFDAATFDPERWRPYLPNPALDQRTLRDVRWGARIVAAFPDELIRAAVERGRYSDPRATEYLVRTLIERREKIAARWLSPAEIAELKQDPH